MDESALVARLHAAEVKLGRNGRRDVASCRAELAQWRQRQPEEIETQCSVPDPMSQLVLVGVCLRYGLLPYHKSKRARVTLYVRAPRGFVKQVLWPEVDAAAQVLERELMATTQRVVEQWLGLSLSGITKQPPQQQLDL